MTSPPYWGLRKYAGEQSRIWGGDPECEHEWPNAGLDKIGHRGKRIELPNPPAAWSTREHDLRSIGGGTTCQLCGAWYGSLGLEPTPEQHTENIVEICREVRRVLRDDGVFWINYGDSYAGSGGENANTGLGSGDRSGLYRNNPRRTKVPQGSLMMIPHRVALALQQDGWIIRQDLVWFKRNPMPESVNGWRWQRERKRSDDDPRGGEYRDDAGQRPQRQHSGSEFAQPEYEYGDDLELRKGSWRHTRAHEYVFMLTKKMQYWSNQEAVREMNTAGTIERLSSGPVQASSKNEKNADIGRWGGKDDYKQASGRNPRSVIKIATAPYKGAHYATFPPNLIAPLIRATCPRWACPVCGQGWAAVVDNSDHVRIREGSNTSGGSALEAAKGRHGNSSIFKTGEKRISNVLGYRPTCEHLALSCTDCGNMLEYLYAKTNPIMRQLRHQISGPQSKPQVLLSEVLSRDEDDSTAGLRTVREEFRSEMESEPSLLQQAMLRKSNSVDSAQHKGMVHNKQRLQTDIRSRSSDGLEGGLRDGTSSSDGEASGKDAQAKRSGPSSERNQGRQPNRKSKANDEAKTRHDEKTQVHGNLSVVPNDLSREGSCPRCGSQSLAFTIPEPNPGIVFDCFVGSGTTVKVAQDLLRYGIGLDISYQYLDEQAKLRTQTGTPSKALDGLPLFNLEENNGK